MFNLNHVLHGIKPADCHTVIVPVRFPQSDSLFGIDLVQFHLDNDVCYLTLIAQIEAAYIYAGDEDRLTAAEAAYDSVAKQNNGAWEYLKTDLFCAELY